jgi:hypothetical protein
MHAKPAGWRGLGFPKNSGIFPDFYDAVSFSGESAAHRFGLVDFVHPTRTSHRHGYALAAANREAFVATLAMS